MQFELLCNSSGESYRLDRRTIKIGSLLSNQIVIARPEVEPVHALLQYDGSAWKLSNLSDSEILVNAKVTGEAHLKPGDMLTIAGLAYTLREIKIKDEAPLKDAESKDRGDRGERRASGQIFSPRTASSGKGVLEVVSYWGRNVLEVEHFHPSMSGFREVSVGDPEVSHFADASLEGKKHFRHVLADVGDNSYTLHLNQQMTARIRSGEKVREVGAGSHPCSAGDIAHVRSGPISYFFNFTSPPELSLPPEGINDPLFFGLMSTFMLIYVATIFVLLFVVRPEDPSKRKIEIWSVVTVPEKPLVKRRPRLKKELKLKRHKPSKLPVKVSLPKTPAPPKPVEVAASKPALRTHKKLHSRQIERLTHAKTQARAHTKKHRHAHIAHGTAKSGGRRAGKQHHSRPGRSKARIKKASGINLQKLGLGVGAVSSLGVATSIHTAFRSSSGGLGSGSGNAAKTYGLGGAKREHSLGIEGARGVVSEFGGEGLVKGKDLEGLAAARGASIARVTAADPLVSGGMSQGEILAVIRAHQNQLRHCYQKLLQRSPGASGIVKLEFTIAITGRVASSKLAKSSLGDQALGSCIVGAVRRWKFPRPRGNAEVVVSYPFTFQPV